MKNLIGSLFLISLLITMTHCGETTMKPSVQLQSDSITEKEWNSLSLKKIYLGHMSVGYNIIDGIKDLIGKNKAIRLNIQESIDMKNYSGGVFLHSRNGRNGDPKSKVDAFVTTMNNGMGKQAAIAFFKFCYVDFNENTNVNDVFTYYRSAMKGLIKKYPDTVILHATAPLTTEGEKLGTKDKVKDIIKKITGRATRADKNVLSNIKRNEFNALLTKEYGENEIIDIAKYESTSPDGKEYLSKKPGAKHPSMVPDYTSDGGHLNDTGRLAVADKVLVKLAKMR